MADVSEVQREDLGSNIAGIGNFLIDPKAAAARAFTKWFWVGPVVLFMLVSMVGSILVTPIVQNVLLSQPVPAGANPETYRTRIEMSMKVQRFIGLLFPIVMVGFQALVMWGMASVVAIEAKYRQMLNIASGCTVIQVLAAVAGIIILKSKGEISSVAELRPALGLDIFLGDGTNKVLLALANYFSIFEVWWIVMMILVIAAAYRISKLKSVIIVAPLIAVSLTFRLIVAAFQKT
jgi:hypothetical protein